MGPYHPNPRHGIMPSPMDECDNLVNIEVPPPSALDTILKRKLDDSSEELTFPFKKVAVCPPSLVKSNCSDGMAKGPHNTASKPQQPKLTKAEREAVKAEKAREKELERQKREEEKVRREEERIKKVFAELWVGVDCRQRNEMS